jgi:hypothetical protein
LAGCSWYPSRLLKSTVHHRLYIQWVVSNQCNWTRNRNTKRKNIRCHTKLLQEAFKAIVVPGYKCSRSCCLQY